MLKKINDNAYEIDLPSHKYALSSTFKMGQVTSNTPKGPTTRARARQLNNEVTSLLFESCFDISESWILPHAPYLYLISFAGEDVERDGDRKTKGGLLFQARPVRPPSPPVQPAWSLAGVRQSSTGGPTAGNAGPTGAAGLSEFRPSQLAVRPPATAVRPAAAGLWESAKSTGGPTARHAGPTGASGPTGSSTPVGPEISWAEPHFLCSPPPL